ncbi:tyrosine-type recombinase/integrase [Cereibacter azotoformans]|uniref:tyrosine-type recombinase/integrase n=1 Tax=Cereibacter azotoformans TaxID=43057 RepID=UPI000C6CB484|nr:site-specific integrase [Cereibacter azotoformans]
MPKKAREWGALDVKRAQHSGANDRNEWHAVGGVAGLMIQVAPSGAKSWLLRTAIGTRRRAIGLGSYPEVSLADARDRAREAKRKIAEGIDPIAERKATKAALAAAEARAMTFADAVEAYLKEQLEGLRNAKHRAQWRSTLETYALPEMGKILVSDVTTQDVLRALKPIWGKKAETASRVRGRIEAVIAWAEASGYRAKGDNPARWDGNLKLLLPTRSKSAPKGKQPALARGDAQRWFFDLRGRDGMGSRALEFLVLTAARSGEVRGATWSEIDLGAGLWVIPAERMKAGREHRVPLPAAAVALVENLPRMKGSDLVFTAARGGMLSDMTLSATMRRMHADAVEMAGGDEAAGYLDPSSRRPAVPHGLRSTFRSWTADVGYDRDMAEIALAHEVGSEVERAYQRSDMIERRRAMMDRWADFLAGRDRGVVIELRTA